MPAYVLIILVVMLILMSAATLLIAIMARQKSSELNKDLRNLSVFVLGHMIFSIFVSYCIINSVDLLPLIKPLHVVSDIWYFAVIATWINVIGAFTESLVCKTVVKERLIYEIIAVYGVICECVAVLSGNRVAGSNEVFVSNEGMRHALVLLNALFGVAVLVISIVFLVLSVRTKIKSVYRSGAVFFSSLLILYMVWILIFDYNTVSGVQNSIVDRISIDPLFIICSLLDVAVLFFFFKKDPLEIFSTHSVQQKEERLDAFAERYMLTGREKEVLGQVCMGRNNPDIAEALFISEYTVKRHMNKIFQKTEVKNRYELLSKVLGK